MNLDNSRLNQVVEHLGRYVKVLRLKTIVLHIIARLQKSILHTWMLMYSVTPFFKKLPQSACYVSDFKF